MYNGRRAFRPSTATKVVSIAITALFIAAALVLYRTNGLNWITIGLGIAVLIGVGGILESFVLRILLTDEAMIITDLRGSRRYARADIQRIEEAKGSPPAILLKQGRWVKLPSVTSNLGNSVRAWLKNDE